MKKHLAGLLTELRTGQLEKLTTIVAETLATGFNVPKSKIFTAADLWNIQRQKKVRLKKRMPGQTYL